MNNKIKYKNSKPDAQDKRINHLIAKYSYVCQDVDKLKPKRKRTNDSIKNTFPLSTTEIGQKSRDVRAYPICSNGRYFYKFRNSSNSGQDDGLNLLPGHDYNSSYISNNTGTDLSDPKINDKCPSEDTRSTLKINIQDGCKHMNQQISLTSQNVRKKSYTKNATYYSPVIDSYDRKFVSKEMERNAKLQKLLIKYAISRQTEKAKENHCDTPILQDLYYTKDEEYPKSLAVYEKKKHNISLATTLCENYLNKYLLPCRVDTGKYENPKSVNCTYRYHETKIQSDDKNFLPRELSKTGQHFQPIQSTSLNQLSNCDFKQNREAQTHITFGGYTGNCLTNELHTTDVEIQDMTIDMNEVENNGATKENHDKIVEPVYNPSIISDITRPSVRNLELLTTDVEKRAMVKDMNEVEDIATIEQNHDTVEQSVHHLSRINDVTNPAIRNVEEKLDILIDLLNSLASELKSKKMLGENKSKEVDKNREKNESLKTAISKTRMRIVCNVMTNTTFCASESNLTPSHYFLNMRLDKILCEEVEKSNLVRNEIADMLNKSSRSSAEVNVEIPTKERSTEVTASLSKTKLDYRRESTIVEDISYRGIARNRLERRIAVNTELLGLPALLRLCSAAMKQILSFVPALSWYLPMAIRPVHNFDYVCNICGAAFARPSQLNAHILRHDFDQPRECRVCRRTVSQRSSQLFRCQHCGRMFARAYCCQLHERECHAARGLKKSLSRALLR